MSMALDQPTKIEQVDGLEVTLELAESSISGQVSCSTGPVANTTVSAGIISTFTDSKGKFLLEHVPPGILKLRAKSPSARFYNYEQDILIEAGKKKEGLFLFLNEVTGTIEGSTKDENGKPLANAEISGLFRLAQPPTTVKSDEKGHFVIPDIPRGSYYVRARAAGHMIEGATVNVTGGSVAQTDFVLKAADLTISGKVQSKKEGSPLDSEIYLMRKGIVVTKVNTTKSEDGKFVIENLVPDIYEIALTCPGYVGKGWREKVETSLVVNFDLEEQPPVPDTPFDHR